MKKNFFYHFTERVNGEVNGINRSFLFTICGIYDPETGKFTAGMSSQNVIENCYNKKLSNVVALGRAEKRPSHNFNLEPNLNGKDVFNIFKEKVIEDYLKNPGTNGNSKNFKRIRS